MSEFQIRNYLPYFFKKRLWADKKKFGLSPYKNDKFWEEWLKTYSNFYFENQRNNIGNFVNDIRYRIMSKLDLKNKKILEIGARDIRHMNYWKDYPKKYIFAVVSADMMQFAEQKFNIDLIPYENIFLNKNQTLPFKDNSIDVIVSFYSLEHLNPINLFLDDLKRLFKEGGIIVGAITTEGGLAWGLGRMLTTRNLFLKKTNIKPDEIICWKHPNLSDKILLDMNKVFNRKKGIYWPFNIIKNIDFNLKISFIYKN